MSGSDETEQERTWGILYDQIRAILLEFGEENAFGDGDYWVLDDNWGVWQHKVEVHNLKMLKPHVVESLRALLAEHADWEIVIGVDIPNKEGLWPPMGLILRHSEI